MDDKIKFIASLKEMGSGAVLEINSLAAKSYFVTGCINTILGIISLYIGGAFIRFICISRKENTRDYDRIDSLVSLSLLLAGAFLLSRGMPYLIAPESQLILSLINFN